MNVKFQTGDNLSSLEVKPRVVGETLPKDACAKVIIYIPFALPLQLPNSYPPPQPHRMPATNLFRLLRDRRWPGRRWRALPDELKVMILKYALLSEHPQNLYSSQLTPFLLVSQHMGDPAKEIWFTNKFRNLLKPTDMQVKPFPAEFGQHIRRLEVELTLTDTLSWTDLDRVFELAKTRTTPWRVLLAATHHTESPLSAWQTKLPNLPSWT